MARGKKGTNARVKKLYTGRGSTRPIPLVEYEGDKRAARAAAADQRSKGKAVNMPSGPRVGGVSEVFGTKVSGTKGSRGGTFNPATGLDKTI